MMQAAKGLGSFTPVALLFAAFMSYLHLQNVAFHSDCLGTWELQMNPGETISQVDLHAANPGNTFKKDSDDFFHILDHIRKSRHVSGYLLRYAQGIIPTVPVQNTWFLSFSLEMLPFLPLPQLYTDFSNQITSASDLSSLASAPDFHCGAI